jgi:hypothetical protein
MIRSIICRARAIFGSTVCGKCWCPNPGFTVMTSSRRLGCSPLIYRPHLKDFV